MMKKNALAAILSLFVILLSGCAVTLDFKEGESTVMKQEAYTISDVEVRLVALSYKNRYENYYEALLGKKFWEEEVSDDATFETVILRNYVLNELQTVLSLNIIARKEKLSLSTDELNDIDKKARILAESMTDDAKAYTKANEKNIVSILKKYALAYKAEQFLLADNSIEISDEQSRVIEIEVIHTKTVEDADSIYQRLLLGENFGTLAKENTIDDRINYSVAREDLSEPFDSILFSLEEGQTSEVVAFHNEGFIFRVVSSYSMLLSKSNKHNMLAKTRYESLTQVVSSYRIGSQIQVNQSFFKKLSLKEEGAFGDFSLFD